MFGISEISISFVYMTLHVCLVTTLPVLCTVNIPDIELLVYIFKQIMII